MAPITACTRSGLKDWFVQRLSAVIVLFYGVFIIIAVLYLPDTNPYHAWQALFHNIWVQIFTILAFLSLIGHAWVGMWTIFTDYIKCPWLAGSLQVLAILGYLVCFIWLICILFS